MNYKGLEWVRRYAGAWGIAAFSCTGSGLGRKEVDCGFPRRELEMKGESRRKGGEGEKCEASLLVNKHKSGV